MRLLGGCLLASAIVLGSAGCDGDDGGDRADRSRSPAEARRCLDADGFQTRVVHADIGEDRNAPNDAVFAYSSGTHAEIAFYDDLARAKRYEPEVRARSKGFKGEVERHDRVTIVWLTRPPAPIRQRVERCVVAS